MKKNFFLLTVLILLTIRHTNAQVDSNYYYLNNLDFNYYLNKPIDSLLSAVPLFVSSQLKIYGELTTNKARVLELTYPNQVRLYVYTKNFQFMNPVDPSRIWDVTLFRKENAFYIELTYEGLSKKEAIAD